jgi:hypothetical protein
MADLLSMARDLELPRCGFQTGATLTDVCGLPAFYVFEIDRDHWNGEDSRVPTHAPLTGYCCLLHGARMREMPAVFNVRTIR